MGLTFDRVTYRYGPRRAPVFQEFSWSVPDGKTVLLGPNGAGKSTALALAAGVFKPSRGRCTIDGGDVGAKHARRENRDRIGWMPQGVRPVKGLRAREQVAFAGWLQGLSRRDAWKESERALSLVGLTDESGRRSHELSGGQLRRLGLAEVLVHRPKHVLLDEPTAGLDPHERERFQAIMRTLPDPGSVVVSTHQVDDLEESYDAVVVMFGGRIAFSGTVRDFLALAPPGSERAPVAAYSVLAAWRGRA